MKCALVLEGGASRAYFSVGAMDVFLEHDIMADYVIGASAGIADGISYVFPPNWDEALKLERSIRQIAAIWELNICLIKPIIAIIT